MFDKLLSENIIWVVLVLLGQAVFGGAFVLQWIVSERLKRSHVPVSFWYMRIVGSVILSVCAFKVYLRYTELMGLVFMLGFALPCLIYVRTLVRIHRRHVAVSAGAPMAQDETP